MTAALFYTAPATSIAVRGGVTSGFDAVDIEKLRRRP
jgi:hypothetical protein